MATSLQSNTGPLL